jgi:hypothetical protein
MARASKDLVEARLRDLVEILLDGAEPGWDLCETVREWEQKEGSAWHLAEGEKPLSYSQLRRYAARAEKLIAESCRASRKQLLRRHLARRRRLYATAVQQGDTRAALAVLQDEARLEGLYPPTKIAPTNPKGDKPYDGTFSDAERLASLRALYARLGLGDGTPPPGGDAHGDGPLVGGAVPGDDGRRADAGQMADDPSPFFLRPGPSADDPTGREEHDGRGAGPQDRSA